MSYGFLWIETLLACLLSAATSIAVSLRRKTRKTMVMGCGSGIMMPLVPLGYLVAFTAILRNNSFLWAVAVLVICYLGGSAVIVTIAARRDKAGIRRAFSWPVGRLTTAWLVVLALIAMTFGNLDLRARMEIQGLRAKAETLALSVAPPQVPDSLNAAPVYAQAEEQFKTTTVAADQNVDYRDLDPRSPQVTDYLQRQQKTLAILRRAADMPACRLDYDYTRPDIEVAMREPGPFRQGANLLAVAAQAQAAAGNVDLALADCRRMYAIGDHASAPPTLISGLVTISIDALASKTVAQVLPFATAQEQLTHFAALDPQAISRLFARTLHGEEAYGLAMFCDLASGKGGTEIWLIRLQNDVGIYQDNLRRLRNLASQPYYQTFAERKQIEEYLQRGFFAALIGPPLLGAFQIVPQAQALRSAVGLACAATRYRLDHGDYPAQAALLVPEYLDALPLDPFDGQPLRFKKTGAGSVAIYSIGPDGVDNGGAVEAKNEKNGPADVGIILKTPASR